MKKRVPFKKRPAPKKKKSNKCVNWLVVVKDGCINAAIDNHINTEAKLLEMGYEIVGCPSMVEKNDAINYIEEITGKYYKKEPRK
jgi:hypothetical protein